MAKETRPGGRDLVDGVRLVAAVVGIGALAYGCWLHYPPLGFIVGGALLTAASLIGALRAG